MSYSEKSVSLTPDEIDTLRKGHRTGTILSLIILTIILGVAAIFFKMGEDFLPFRIFAPIFGAMGILIVVVNFYQQRKDIQGGVKTVISGIIEDKKETHTSSSNSTRSSHSYIFIVGSKEIEVNSSNYSKFHINDRIEVTKLPHVGTILDIRLIESSTGISSKQIYDTKLDGSPLHDARSISAPSFSESSYPLDSSEEQYLRRTRNKRAVRSFRWALIPVWIFMFFKFLAADYDFIMFFNSFSLSIPLFIVLLPSVIQALRIPRLITPYNRDIESGMKVICRTTITDKFHGIRNRNAFYALNINKKEYSVPEDFYNKIDVGEEITLNYAEHSKTEFSIQSTNNSSKFLPFYS